MMNAQPPCIRWEALASYAICLIAKSALISVYACIVKMTTGTSWETVWMIVPYQPLKSLTHWTYVSLVRCIAVHVTGMTIVRSATLHLLRLAVYVLIYVT